METLPHVLRESQFRRFERFIAEAVNAYPKALNLSKNTLGLSPTSFAARLRDAKASYSKNNWPSVTIDRERFISLEDNLNVSQLDNGDILFGSAEAIRRLKAKSNEIEVEIPIIESMSPERSLHLADLPLKGFLMLLSHKRLLQPRIKVLGLTDTEAQSFQSQFDISLDKHEDGSYILI
jgi:hypothetical protein